MKMTNNSRCLRFCMVPAMMAFGGAASAGEFLFNPYASGQYLYDSNVYKFSSQVADVTGTTDTSDRSQRYIAGLDSRYTWQKQKVHALVEGRRILFHDFTHLDHNEYALDAGFDGGILSNTTGMLNYHNERRMASFEDRRSTQLTMEHEQIGQGGLSFAVAPDWHIVTGARIRYLLSPLPEAPALPQPPPGAAARLASPDFAVHERTYNAGVQYGIENKAEPETEAPLVVGVMLEHQTVNFSGVTPQPPPPPGVTRDDFEGYRLLSLQATAQYVVSGLSNLDGKLGVAQYKPKSSGSSKPELIGEIGYTRKLTGVTELNLHLFRRIVAFAASADSTTDTGASIGAKWEPILDLGVLANYSYATSHFGGSSVAPENSGRSDKVQNASLSVAYPLFHYFGVRLFGTYTNRSSNLAFDNYSDKIVGLELSFRWHQPGDTL